MPARVRLIEEARRRANRVRLDLGLEIRGARLAAGLRMRDVGRAIGRSDSWVSRVERGLLVHVSYVELSVLAAVVGLKMWTTTEAADVIAADFPLGTRAVLRALTDGRDPGANGIVVL